MCANRQVLISWDSIMDNVLDALRFLSAPFADDGGELTVAVAKETPESLLSSLTSTCLQKLNLKESTVVGLHTDLVGEISASCKFSTVVLEALKILKEQIEEVEACQTEEEKSIEVISLQTQMNFQKSMEIIIGFGILPYLIPGLGICEKARKLDKKVSLFIESDERIRDVQKYFRLAHTVEGILNVTSHPSLNALTLPKHSDHLLAAYLQLCLSPIKKPELLPLSGSSHPALTVDEYTQVMTKRESLKELYDARYFQLISKVALVKSLLVLGGTNKPRWVPKCSKEIMYNMVLRTDNGIVFATQAVLESLGRANLWKATRVMTNLVKEAVNGSPDLPVETAVAKLCVQTYNMIASIETSGSGASTDDNREQMSAVAMCCGLTLQSICKQVTMEKLWQRLFGTLLNVPEKLGESGEVSLSVESVRACIDFADKLVATPSAIDFAFPFEDFQALWSLLFQIFATCAQYLQRKVQDPDITDIAENFKMRLHSILLALISTCYSLAQSQEKHMGWSLSTSQFLISLVLNDRRESASFSISRYCFELTEVLEDDKSSLKILARNFSTDNQNESILEVLASDCSALCATIVQGDMKRIAGALLSELLSFAEKSDLSGAKLGTQSLTAFDLREREICEKFVALQLLSELGKEESILEDLGAMDDPSKMLSFLELILGKQVLELDSSTRTGDDYEFGQSLMFSLTILSALCDAKTGGISSSLMGEEIKYSWEDLQKFLPHLQKLKETGHFGLISAGVAEMVEDILILIETKGRGDSGRSTKVKSVSRYEMALQDVGNPMLPIKGHGLLSLKRLIEEKDEDALKNEANLVEIFKREMKNNDSYVYLMAIKGMGALTSRFHSSVMPLLINEYGTLEGSYSSQLMASMKSEDRAEFCMKVGEVLVSVVKTLGSIAPVYKRPLTNVFFHLVRDDDPLIRASALSNLGELCHLLKFDLATVLTEVWYCVEALLQLEKHLEVRRAALHLLVLLLRGLEKEFTSSDIVHNEEYGRHLRDARRLLTRIYEYDQDTVSKIHCQLALQEIEMIVRKLLIPSDKLEFNIRLLNL